MRKKRDDGWSDSKLSVRHRIWADSYEDGKHIGPPEILNRGSVKEGRWYINYVFLIL